MSENDEVIALLREIRDLQKAHFARYQEFTGITMKRQEEAVKRQEEALERQSAAAAQSRETLQQYRAETQQQLLKIRQSASRLRVLLYVLIALLLLCVFGIPVLSMIVSLLRR